MVGLLHNLRNRLLTTLVILVVSIFLLRILFIASEAQAESVIFHPNFCLGGWEKPQSASGEPQLGEGSESSEYNVDNSAYLESGVAAQIFCGYFPVENREKPPRSVKVSFNWMMKGNIPNPISPITTPTPTVNNNEGKIEEVVENLEENIEPEPEATSSVEVIEESAPIEEPAQPAEEPIQTEPQTQTESSLLNLFLTQRALAQTIDTGSFIDVSYSIDGIRWISVGKVNSTNWQNYAVDIPVNSWNDLDKIQVMLNIIPTVDSKPDIYLESMNLEVNYDETLIEMAKDGLEQTASVATAVTNAVTQTIITIISPATIVQAPLPEPVVVKEKNLLFNISKESIATKTNIPWYTNEFREDVSKFGPFYNSPDVEVSDEGKSLTVSGSCSEKYFVILLWKSKTDYIERPGSFAWNFADECQNGNFSYDLKSISKDIPDGTYYLMFAVENEDDPWVPNSALLPIEVTHVIEEKTVSPL